MYSSIEVVGDAVVTVYKDPQYGGESLTFTEGVYDLADYGSSWKNEMSSAHVTSASGDGYVIMYNYPGANLTNSNDYAHKFLPEYDGYYNDFSDLGPALNVKINGKIGELNDNDYSVIFIPEDTKVQFNNDDSINDPSGQNWGPWIEGGVGGTRIDLVDYEGGKYQNNIEQIRVEAHYSGNSTVINPEIADYTYDWTSNSTTISDTRVTP